MSKVLRRPWKSEVRLYEVLHLPCKIILANPDLTPVSLVLRLPREIYLRRSSSNVQRMPAFLKLLQNPHILLTFGRCKIPCACHAKPYPNFKKWSETLRHVLRATTACNFSRMRSKGSRFTLGVWGLRVCCPTVRNRPEVSVWRPYGRAYGEFCNRGHFWKFWASRSLFRVAGVALRGTSWHFVTFRRVL